MDEAVKTTGLLLHARRDWPCSLCRPGISPGNGFLCVDCAHVMVLSSFTRPCAVSPRMGDLAAAPAHDAPEANRQLITEWSFLRFAGLDSED